MYTSFIVPSETKLMIFGHIFFAKITLTYINKCMVYWASPCIDHIPKVFFQYLFFQKSYHIKQLSRPKLNYCPVRNVSDGTFFNIHYFKSEILTNYFLCIIWSSHVLRRKIMNILFIKRLVCELLKLFVAMIHRSDKNDFWTYFLQRSHWHTSTNLWYTGPLLV